MSGDVLARLSALDCRGFVEALGDVFECSPWVAEAAWAQRPFASEAALHGAMMAAVRGAPAEVRVAFLRGHPELAGAEARAGTMTAHSTVEQRSGGLDALDRNELAELQRLNAAYAARHGFPFIIQVQAHTKAQIFDALRERVARPTVEEHEVALAQVEAITRRRLQRRLAA
jgi:2-oxo-4-hydroxy-4-carboxy-5-ureidoimidazoline decarboxylase